MSDDKTPAIPRNKPVAKTTLTYTMIHPVELDPGKMNPENIAYHLGDGEFVGERTAIHTTPVSDAAVNSELQALGGNTDWFKIDEPDPLEE